ncbi:hypothetical protein [Ascidiaceihabitans sp.]
MSKTALPQSGGSFVRDPKGKLTKAQPAPKPAKPKAVKSTAEKDV